MKRSVLALGGGALLLGGVAGVVLGMLSSPSSYIAGGIVLLVLAAAIDDQPVGTRDNIAGDSAGSSPLPPKDPTTDRRGKTHAPTDAGA